MVDDANWPLVLTHTECGGDNPDVFSLLAYRLEGAETSKFRAVLTEILTRMKALHEPDIDHDYSGTIEVLSARLAYAGPQAPLTQFGTACAQKPPMHLFCGALQQSPSPLHLSPTCEQPPGGGTQAKLPMPSGWQKPVQHSNP